MFNIKSMLPIALCLALLASCGPKRVDYLDNDNVEVTKISLDTSDKFPVAHMYFTHKDKDDVISTVYRIEWLNEQGATIETTSWRPITIHGKRNIPVSEKATVQGAVDFRVLISNDPR